MVLHKNTRQIWNADVFSSKTEKGSWPSFAFENCNIAIDFEDPPKYNCNQLGRPRPCNIVINWGDPSPPILYYVIYGHWTAPYTILGWFPSLAIFFTISVFFWNLVLGEKLICVLILTEVWTFVIWGCVFSARVCVCGSQTQLFQNQGPQSAPSFCTLAHKACAVILHKGQTWNLEMEVRCFFAALLLKRRRHECNVTSDSWGFVS